jgi:hypothetical protein
MEQNKDAALARLAADQHGVFTIDQTTRLGFRSHHREFRLRAGRWQSVFSGVYRIAGTPPSWRAELLSACWAVRGLAAASHRSAAALWDLHGARQDLLELTCERGRRGYPNGVVVHETKQIGAGDLAEIDSIPVTAVEQTLLGLAAVTRPEVVEMALDRAIVRELTTVARVQELVRRKGARGRNGVGVLRDILGGLDPLAGVPESAMETKLKRLLRRHGLPTPVFQHVIRHEGWFVARVDAAYPELRIAIEFDSYAHHTGRRALVRDTDRRNRLLRIRWATVTFTAADVAQDGGAALEALIAARSGGRT